MSAEPAPQLRRAAECLRAAGLDAGLFATPPNVTYVSGYEAPMPMGYVTEVTGWLPTLALVRASDLGQVAHADVADRPGCGLHAADDRVAAAGCQRAPRPGPFSVFAESGQPVQCAQARPPRAAPAAAPQPGVPMLT